MDGGRDGAIRRATAEGYGRRYFRSIQIAFILLLIFLWMKVSAKVYE